METKKHLTLTELQRSIQATLQVAYPMPLWVSAEISEIKVNSSGHCYLELVEKGDASSPNNGNSRDGVPVSQARAVIWRTAYPKIAYHFEAETGQRLTAGLRILARVTVNYHELYGFSLNITDIDPSFTLGDMERQRQLTIAQLQADGVWEMNRELRLPPVVQRIAVVSSRQAAGYQDFCNELAGSGYAFSPTLFEAVMQGAAAEESIIAALDEIAQQQEAAGEAGAFDAVVIIRGGGSTSDLGCFNAYRLCSHVAQFPLPILTGIGHDKDTSVADLVAHTPLKTPTAVATWLVERMAGVEGWLDRAALQIRDAAAGLLQGHRLLLEQLRAELTHRSAMLLVRHDEGLKRYAQELSSATAGFLKRENERLAHASLLVESRSPKHILALGFAVVRRGGAALHSAGQVTTGEVLQVELADGAFETIVK